MSKDALMVTEVNSHDWRVISSHWYFDSRGDKDCATIEHAKFQSKQAAQDFCKKHKFYYFDPHKDYGYYDE